MNRKPLAAVVSDLAGIHGVDVIILAECRVDPGAMLRALNRPGSPGFHLPTGLSSETVVFTRFSRDFLQPVSESRRISIRRLVLRAREPVLLVAVHLPSKLHVSEESQKFACMDLAREIDSAEQSAGHRRTIVVGDFNMNPFESGLVGAGGLHSTMSRQVASRNTRTVQGREHWFFYNPMWNHLGDARGDTAGSYYYDGAEHVNYYWNAFDQVLLRPELAERFDPNSLTIVKSVGPTSLVRADGRPDSANGSDHLPIVFEAEF